jgi:hypothetical protein
VPIKALSTRSQNKEDVEGHEAEQNEKYLQDQLPGAAHVVVRVCQFILSLL